MIETGWIDLPALLSDIVANFVADVCAGALFAVFAAAVAWWVCRELSIFKRLREGKERGERQLRTAIHYLELVDAEATSLLEKIPKWREALTGLRWGTVFIISTPAWELAQRSEEFATLIDPEVLRGLLRFYEGLAHAERWLPMVTQSWLASDNDVESLEGKRTAIIAMAVGGLAQAEEIGDQLLHRLDAEIERLRGLLPPEQPARKTAVVEARETESTE